MKVKYFAWVRERVGKAEETVEPPADVRTVDDLIGWLSRRGETYAYAFETPQGDPRRDRPRPCQAGRRHRRRPRDRLLPADDRRLTHDPEKWEPVFRKDHAQLRSSDDRHRHHPHPGSRFRHRARRSRR